MIIHIETANKMWQCIRIYNSMFIWRSTCFGRHTVHHQEPKTALCCCQVQYCAWQSSQTIRPTTFLVWKNKGRQWSFRLL